MKAWQEVSIGINQEAAEALYAILAEFGAQGVAVDDPALVEIAQEAGMGDYFPELTQHGRIRVSCYLPEAKSSAELAHLKAKIDELRNYGLDPGEVEISTAVVQEKDWAHAWKAYYHPVRIGRIVVQPSWETLQEPMEDRDVIITLDPGMAFGTGTHPTTVMCLEFLQELDLVGKTVWDVGTGSGILAIACAKLGAKVAAADVDVTAVQAAAENRDLNSVSYTITQGSLDSLTGTPDIIVANIIAYVIVDMLPQAAEVLPEGGVLIAGGIIEARAREVEVAAERHGFALDQRKQQQEWVGYCFIKG